MSPLDSSLHTRKCIVEFTLPRLHRGKTWFVDFFALDPATNKMKRKKYMLNRYKTTKEREDMAAILIHNIYESLKGGWNPFANDDNSRAYTKFNVVVKKYRDYIDASEKKGVLKAKTAADYRSRLNLLRDYIDETGVKIETVNQFNLNFCIDFLDYLLLDREVSATTRNNYRTWLSAFASFLVERRYIAHNPVGSIKQIKESTKFREPLSPEALARLGEYTSRENPPFHLACLMEYYTFIRPNELRHIRVGDISIKDQVIYIAPEVAKNGRGQYVAINDTIVRTMIDQHVFDHPSHEYLFGWDLVPGEKQIYVNRFRLEWNKVRKALRFPDTYQFYSLKDSGIRDLANAEGIVVARDQARHADVSVTNRYLKDPKSVHQETKKFKGGL